METIQSRGGALVPRWRCLDAASTEVAILSHANSRVLKISPVLHCQLHSIGQISNSKFMSGFLMWNVPSAYFIPLEFKSKHCLLY